MNTEINLVEKELFALFALLKKEVKSSNKDEYVKTFRLIRDCIGYLSMTNKYNDFQKTNQYEFK